MPQAEPVIIRPTWGGPSLKKNGQLGFVDGDLVATDRRGRTRRISLSDSRGPYQFAYGDTWVGGANYAVVDASGRAVVLVDLRAFKSDDTDRLQTAAGLDVKGVAEQPPAQPDVLALVDPPYIKLAMAAFYPGVAAFGLWSVTRWTPLIGIVVLAFFIMIPFLILGKTSMPSRKALGQEARALLPKLDESIAKSDAWLAAHGAGPAGSGSEPSGSDVATGIAPPEPSPDGN